MRRSRLLCPLFAAALTASLAPAPAQAGPLPVAATLVAQYNATAAAVNSVRALVYTLYNTNPTSTISPYFEVTMPPGLSNPSGASTTCPLSDISTSPSGRTALPYTTWYFDGYMSTGTISCTVTITVTSATEGTFTTCPADMGSNYNVTTPSCTSIRFAVAHPARNGAQ
ncbi:hypothetical protein [Actinokineospora enzanensis]|uniref:DUF7933 domain-containing protein n=1 Tax=Actinokineospora enzanensis TaxID=155975 RepID=UPI000379472B|nr:hypothetical protein [Actinokineospora enzanensis]